MAEHRAKSKVNPDTKLYREFAEIGISHFRIKPIEWFKCESKHELLAREQYYIDLLEPDLNCNDAITNYEKIREQQKRHDHTYYERNKERKKQKQKQYYENNTELIKTKYEANREIILALKSERIYCEQCDCTVRRDHISTHKKSKKHQSNSK